MLGFRFRIQGFRFGVCGCGFGLGFSLGPGIEAYVLGPVVRLGQDLGFAVI